MKKILILQTLFVSTLHLECKELTKEIHSELTLKNTQVGIVVKWKDKLSSLIDVIKVAEESTKLRGNVTTLQKCFKMTGFNFRILVYGNIPSLDFSKTDKLILNILQTLDLKKRMKIYTNYLDSVSALEKEQLIYY